MIVDFNLPVFVASTAVILLTPGPTNTLLAVGGLARGMRAWTLVVFEMAGYLIAISAWGVFLTSVQQHYPWLGTVVRVASSCYLAYIAVKIWRSTRMLAMQEQHPVNPAALFTATLLNPKGLVFASAIFPPHAFDSLPAYLGAMGLFTCLLVPIGLIWIRFGAVLGRGRLAWISPARLQRVAALAISVFSVSIAWTAFH